MADYSSSVGGGITAFSSAYASGILTEAKYESQDIITTAMNEYRRTQQTIHNNAVDRNAREQTNVVTMNELFATAEAQKTKMDIRLEALSQAGKASVLSNVSGVKGATVDRLTKQITESAAIASGQVDDSMAKQQLSYTLEKNAIEKSRLGGQSYSVFLGSEKFQGNPMMQGILDGLATGGSIYSKMNVSTKTEQQTMLDNQWKD